MTRVVQKFGGTSVGNVERIRNAATRIKTAYERGERIAVIVSAMAGKTNRLVELCANVAPLHDAREYDVVVSSGEQVTCGLMALALQELGVPARSWLAWQIPIRTDDVHGKARIEEIDTEEIGAHIDSGEVAVVAGFQGLGPSNRLTTLGRGGSDASAVALAAALGAERCDIFTDVDGVYTSDPRIVTKARKLDNIAYEEMLEMASLGAKVLQTRAVELAMRHRVTLQVLSSSEDLPGTLLVDEDQIVEKDIISGIAYSRNESKVTLTEIADRPGLAAMVFGPLAGAGVNVDMIVQSASHDGESADITFTVGTADLERALAILGEERGALGFNELLSDSDVVKVSVIGVGMRTHAGVARTMFETLSEKGINIQVISTSEI
ncbi:MAG TPA: aspartate kinase, partial [Alphaproteobacteria bacterium]|nr:aspartate kinase [Alphaproteobacteria bacterium]